MNKSTNWPYMVIYCRIVSCRYRYIHHLHVSTTNQYKHAINVIIMIREFIKMNVILVMSTNSIT